MSRSRQLPAEFRAGGSPSRKRIAETGGLRQGLSPMRAAALILAVALALPLSGRMLAAPPQNPPAFQVRSDAVRLDVRVIDEEGRFVPDLTRDDFHVVDEGIGQPI